MKRKRIIKFFADDRGLTFAETVIAIAITLLITTMVAIPATKQLTKAKHVKAQTTIENISLALTTYYLDCGMYPSEQQGLDSLRSKPTIAPIPTGWNGPYLTRDIGLDPWNNEYIYQVPGPEGQEFGIMTYGKDQIEGGEGENKDTNSWE